MSVRPEKPTVYVQFEDPTGELWKVYLEERVEDLEQFARDVGTVLVRDGHGDEKEHCPFCALVRRLRELEIAFGP